MIMRIRIWLIFLLMLFTTQGLIAEPRKSGQKPTMRNSLVQGQQGVTISNQHAAGNVRQEFPGSKILSIKMIGSNGPPVYKIKTLSGNGVVKFVYVDGTSGEVFE